jgi:hypothetical protein
LQVSQVDFMVNSLYSEYNNNVTDWQYYAMVFLIQQTFIPRQRLAKRLLSLHTNS